MTQHHYEFASLLAAKTAHEAIDDARCGGVDRHWPVTGTERHTRLHEDTGSWWVKTTVFTEGQRGTEGTPGPLWGTLPVPVRHTPSGARIRVDPKRTDVLASR